jgi:dihydrodipicolinate synthase/N-acetylneuraminate lyase
LRAEDPTDRARVSLHPPPPFPSRAGAGSCRCLRDAVCRGDLQSARALHDALLEINKAVFFDTNPIPMKYMMMRCGIIPKNEHRLPMAAATEELGRQLDGVLERAGLGGKADR